jgi:hypothetical protein
MDALLAFLDYLVAELEQYLEIELAEQAVERLHYLNAVAYLDELRQSDEYRKLH